MSANNFPFDNSTPSHGRQNVINKLVKVPLLCNVLERQIHEESPYQHNNRARNFPIPTIHPHIAAQRHFVDSINKANYAMFHAPVEYRRHSVPGLPGHNWYPQDGGNAFQFNSQQGVAQHYRARNEHYVRRHSNITTRSQVPKHETSTRTVSEEKSSVISHLELESRQVNPEKTVHDSKKSENSPLEPSRNNSSKGEIPVVIDLTESNEQLFRNLKPNDVRQGKPVAQAQPEGKYPAAKSENESKDALFHTTNSWDEQQRGKPGVKRRHFSEANLDFSDNSFKHKKMRRASGPERFHDQTSLTTSPRLMELPFTLETLTEEMEVESKKNAQCSDLLAKKLTLRAVLEEIFQDQLPGCALYLVGSSTNGNGNKDSDADFCLMLTQWREIDQINEARRLLVRLNQLLKSCYFVENSRVIFATVPIIKFVDAVSKCECDININNHVGIRNTFLIKAYCKVDSRVTPLVMIVKKWAKTHGINDSKEGTLSSYAFTLMVLHFLQFGCRPPVLPSLQKIYPDLFDDNGDVSNLLKRDIATFIENGRIPGSQNWQKIGALLLGFFQYYATQFSWDSSVISVRLGHTYSKTFGKAKNKYIYIEEPFDYNNVAKTVYNEENFNKIKMKISLAANKLKVSPSLQSIL